MTLSMLFWLLMLIWVIFGAGWNWRVGDNTGSRLVFGGNLILFLLLLTLGWKVFGSFIK